MIFFSLFTFFLEFDTGFSKNKSKLLRANFIAVSTCKLVSFVIKPIDGFSSKHCFNELCILTLLFLNLRFFCFVQINMS